MRVLVTAACLQCCDASAVTPDELARAARETEARFPFKVRIQDVPASIGGKRVAAYHQINSGEYPDALNHLQLLREEFARYPTRFLRKSGLKWIGLVKNLSIGGEPYITIYDVEDRALLFDVRQTQRDERYRRYVVHHEFFHLIDYEATRFEPDKAWLALNPAGFAYRRNRGLRDSGTRMMFEHPKPAFVSTYAMSSEFEDRADIHAALFDREHHRALSRIVETDPVVRSKVAYILQWLGRLDPAVNAAYFERMHGAASDAVIKPRERSK